MCNKTYRVNNVLKKYYTDNQFIFKKIQAAHLSIEQSILETYCFLLCCFKCVRVYKVINIFYTHKINKSYII